MPATTNASVTEGPARSAIAAAVRTKMPAPMIAPMPNATSDHGPKVRFSPPPWALASETSAIKPSIEILRKSEFAKCFPLASAHPTALASPHEYRRSEGKTEGKRQKAKVKRQKFRT